MGASDARERAIADSQFGSGTPATWYFGLSTTLPNDDGTGFTEPGAGSYARKAVTNNATNFPAASTTGGITTKTIGAAITFANPTGSWGTAVAWGAFLASTGGTPEYSAELESNRQIESGNTPVEFPAGELSLTWE